MKLLINLLLFCFTSLALVMCAADGEVWYGIGILLSVICLHLGVSRQHAVDEFNLLAMVAWVGYVADSALTVLGVLHFPASAQVGWPAPVWLTGLWVNFGVTLNSSFGWAADRPRLAAVLGALGGPLGYWVGRQMGVLHFGAPLPVALFVVGLQWAVAASILPALARWIRGGQIPSPRRLPGRVRHLAAGSRYSLT